MSAQRHSTGDMDKNKEIETHSRRPSTSRSGSKSPKEKDVEAEDSEKAGEMEMPESHLEAFSHNCAYHPFKNFVSKLTDDVL